MTPKELSGKMMEASKKMAEAMKILDEVYYELKRQEKEQ